MLLAFVSVGLELGATSIALAMTVLVTTWPPEVERMVLGVGVITGEGVSVVDGG